MANEFGLWMTGRVQWGGAPLLGVRVILKATRTDEEQPVLGEATTNADGWFELKKPPVGDGFLYAVSPTEEFWHYPGQSVSVAAGQWVDGGIFSLCKKIQLLAPAAEAALATLAPDLSWDKFPAAAVYHVDVYNKDTGETLRSRETPDTHTVVDPPLAPGVLYMWWVYAFDADDQIIAYSANPNFTVGEK